MADRKSPATPLTDPEGEETLVGALRLGEEKGEGAFSFACRGVACRLALARALPKVCRLRSLGCLGTRLALTGVPKLISARLPNEAVAEGRPAGASTTGEEEEGSGDAMTSECEDQRAEVGVAVDAWYLKSNRKVTSLRRDKNRV